MGVSNGKKLTLDAFVKLVLAYMSILIIGVDANSAYYTALEVYEGKVKRGQIPKRLSEKKRNQIFAKLVLKAINDQVNAVLNKVKNPFLVRIYIAFDGIPPSSKIAEQILRLFDCSKTQMKQKVDVMDQLLQKMRQDNKVRLTKGDKVKYSEEDIAKLEDIKDQLENPVKSSISRSEIKPGTKLTSYVSEFMRKRVGQLRKEFGCRVVFSGSDEPGEGEHKVMDFFARQVDKARMPVTCVIVGNDGDLPIIAVTRFPELVKADRIFVAKPQLDKPDRYDMVSCNKMVTNYVKECRSLHLNLSRYPALEQYSAAFAKLQKDTTKLTDLMLQFFVTAASYYGNDFLTCIIGISPVDITRKSKNLHRFFMIGMMKSFLLAHCATGCMPLTEQRCLSIPFFKSFNTFLLDMEGDTYLSSIKKDFGFIPDKDIGTPFTNNGRGSNVNKPRAFSGDMEFMTKDELIRLLLRYELGHDIRVRFGKMIEPILLLEDYCEKKSTPAMLAAKLSLLTGRQFVPDYSKTVNAEAFSMMMHSVISPDIASLIADFSRKMDPEAPKKYLEAMNFVAQYYSGCPIDRQTAFGSHTPITLFMLLDYMNTLPDDYEFPQSDISSDNTYMTKSEYTQVINAVLALSEKSSSTVIGVLVLLRHLPSYKGQHVLAELLPTTIEELLALGDEVVAALACRPTRNVAPTISFVKEIKAANVSVTRLVLTFERLMTVVREIGAAKVNVSNLVWTFERPWLYPALCSDEIVVFDF